MRMPCRRHAVCMHMQCRRRAVCMHMKCMHMQCRRHTAFAAVLSDRVPCGHGCPSLEHAPCVHGCLSTCLTIHPAEYPMPCTCTCTVHPAEYPGNRLRTADVTRYAYQMDLRARVDEIGVPQVHAVQFAPSASHSHPRRPIRTLGVQITPAPSHSHPRRPIHTLDIPFTPTPSHSHPRRPPAARGQAAPFLAPSPLCHHRGPPSNRTIGVPSSQVHFAELLAILARDSYRDVADTEIGRAFGGARLRHRRAVGHSRSGRRSRPWEEVLPSATSKTGRELLERLVERDILSHERLSQRVDDTGALMTVRASITCHVNLHVSCHVHVSCAASPSALTTPAR